MTAVQLSDPFADETEALLQRLAPPTELINRIYLRHVQDRSLRLASEVQSWLQDDVVLFLRHDRIKAFTVVNRDVAAMADFVELSDVTFHVDDDARQISNCEEGPLPNKRTVHAWLEGRLVAIEDAGDMPDTEIWCPVGYHPLRNSTFVCNETDTPVLKCSVVRLTCAAVKVWCPRSEVTP